MFNKWCFAPSNMTCPASLSTLADDAVISCHSCCVNWTAMFVPSEFLSFFLYNCGINLTSQSELKMGTDPMKFIPKIKLEVFFISWLKCVDSQNKWHSRLLMACYADNVKPDPVVLLIIWSWHLPSKSEGNLGRLESYATVRRQTRETSLC